MRHKERDAVTEPKVQECMLAASERVLCLHPRIDACPACMVDDRHPREVTYLPPGAPHAQAEVGLLPKQKEPFIEPSRTVERLLASEHERPGRPIAFDLSHVDGGVQFALTQPTRPEGKALGAEGLTKRSHSVREAADRG